MSNINKVLLENFLEYCKKGIYINFQLKSFKIPSIFIKKVKWVVKRDEFIILNELEDTEPFVICNLEECKIEEYEDHIVIHKNKINILIEEWI